jgi:phenylalanyl-tRNA synthetase beta subunit
MFASVVRNRFQFSAFSLIELGSVFERDDPDDLEFCHVGLVTAQRGGRAEDELYSRLKGAIQGWAWQRFARTVELIKTDAVPFRPWEHPHRTAEIRIDGITAGRISVAKRAIRRAMDEHLAAWSIAWAELRIDGLDRLCQAVEPLSTIPEFPLVDLDFSILVPRSTQYTQVADKLTLFGHPLLKLVRHIGSYEGDAIAPDRRSLTFRTVVGDDARTLVDQDVNSFRHAFEQYLTRCGYEIRS